MDIDSHNSDTDQDATEEFTKLVKLSETEFGLSEDEAEIINMGIEEDKKELKMVDNLEQDKMLKLLKKYMDVFP